MDALIFLDQYWQYCSKATLFNLLAFPLILLLCTTLYFVKLSRTSSSELNLPPSLKKLPIIGNLHQLSNPLHLSLQNLSRKHGPLFLVYLGNAPAVIVSSDGLAREVLKTDIAFSDRPQIRAADVLFYGCSDIAFCSYGEYWRQAKKICVLELLSQRRVQGFQSARIGEVAKMVEKIHMSCLDGAVVDLQEILVNISNDVLCRSAFGRTYNGKEGSSRRFGELSRTAMDLTGAFCFKDVFPSLGWMDHLTGLVSRLQKASREVNEFLGQVIEEHVAQEISDDTSDKKDLVDILLHVQKEAKLGINLTRDNLKSILMATYVLVLPCP
ncbi:hypothetical protein Tsubulata_016799, partial [Turnera subulata]